MHAHVSTSSHTHTHSARSTCSQHPAAHLCTKHAHPQTQPLFCTLTQSPHAHDSHTQGCPHGPAHSYTSHRQTCTRPRTLSMPDRSSMPTHTPASIHSRLPGPLYRTFQVCVLKNRVLGMYLEKTIFLKDACTPMFIAALFTIART